MYLCYRQQYIVRGHLWTKGAMRGDIYQAHETEQLPSELYRSGAWRIHPVGQVG